MVTTRHGQHVVPVPGIIDPDLGRRPADRRKTTDTHRRQSVVEVLSHVRVDLTLYSADAQLLCNILLPVFAEKSPDQAVESDAKFIHDSRTEHVGIAESCIAADRLKINRAVVRQRCPWIYLIGILVSDP